MSNVIDIRKDSNYKKCEAIKKLGYEVKTYGKTCLLTSKKYKNLDQFVDVYYRSPDEVLTTLRKDLAYMGTVLA